MLADPEQAVVDDDDDDDDGLESISSDDDDAGSLVDFVVDDDDPVERAPAPVEGRTELDGIDTRNIVLGKRTRRQTQFFEREVFSSPEYKRMMLCDVPPDELRAALDSDDEDLPDTTEDGKGDEDDWKADDSDDDTSDDTSDVSDASDVTDATETTDVATDQMPSSPAPLGADQGEPDVPGPTV